MSIARMAKKMVEAHPKSSKIKILVESHLH
jgi:hypothetical protein